MKRSLAVVALVLAGACASSPSLAGGSSSSAGVEHLHFVTGPFVVSPGTNQYVIDYRGVPKPGVNGFMVRASQNIRYAKANGRCCGPVPPVEVVHLHHAVWLSNGVAGEGEGNGYAGFYPFMAIGEEKTIFEFPRGTGYPIGATDHWLLLRMLHNETRIPRRVYITYDIDFIPDSSAAARGITPVHPIWMDVMDHHAYPVFDALRHSGRNGRFTFPDMAKHPYGSGPPLNQFTIDHPGTLVGTAGHLHPGGLYDELDLVRPGAELARGAIPGPVPHSVRLFRSRAHYFDPRGPVSWDLAMTATAPDWRPRVKTDDVLRISSTYETRLASWYEVMGIMVVWEAWDDQIGLDPFTGKTYVPQAEIAGVDPFRHALDQRGHLTHGHLRENSNYGGKPWLKLQPQRMRSCRTHTVNIAGFVYLPGDLESPGSNPCVPTVKRGQSIKFINQDASPLSPGIPGLAPSAAYLHSIFHTVTGCREPCTLSSGISYPLANSAISFNSGELGRGSPGIGRLSWNTPKSLPPGTYTFFCLIHPFMRGTFRITR